MCGNSIPESLERLSISLFDTLCSLPHSAQQLLILFNILMDDIGAGDKFSEERDYCGNRVIANDPTIEREQAQGDSLHTAAGQNLGNLSLGSVIVSF